MEATKTNSSKLEIMQNVISEALKINKANNTKQKYESMATSVCKAIEKLGYEEISIYEDLAIIASSTLEGFNMCPCVNSLTYSEIMVNFEFRPVIEKAREIMETTYNVLNVIKLLG